MKQLRNTIKIAAVAIGALAFHSCATSPQADLGTSTSSTANTSYEAQLEKEIIELTNKFRAEKGLGKVTYHSGLTHLSRQHSNYMSKNSGKFELLGTSITHFGFEGRNEIAKQLSIRQ